MYTLYNYNNETWTIFKTFATKDEFVVFLARAIKNNHRRLINQTCPYLDGLNMTMKDREHIVRYEYLRDEEGLIQYVNGYPSIRVVHEWNMYPYHVKDSAGRTVDIRNWLPEILDVIHKSAWPQPQRKERQGRSYHRHARGKRILEIDDSYELEDTEMLTDSQKQKLGIRPKLIEESKYYGGPYYSVNGSGWKNHKNEKQWTAKQRRISDATYVLDISKRAIADMMNAVDETDDEELSVMA